MHIDHNARSFFAPRVLPIPCAHGDPSDLRCSVPCVSPCYSACDFQRRNLEVGSRAQDDIGEITAASNSLRKPKMAVKHLGLVRSGLQSVDRDQIRSRSRCTQIQVSQSIDKFWH